MLRSPLLLLLAVSLCSLTEAGQAAAAPAPVDTAVWDNPQEDGVAVYRIPQILVLTSGTVLACAEARYTPQDGSKADIVLRRSQDGGATWSKSQFVERATDKENLVFPLLLEDRENKRLFFFCASRDAGLRDVSTGNFFRTSEDEGKTWSERVDVSPVLKAADAKVQAELRAGKAAAVFAGESPEMHGRELFFFGPGRPIQLSASHAQFPQRLVVPVFLIKTRVGPRNQRGYGDAVMVSDDHGKSWQVPGIAPLGTFGSSEVSVVELNDGRLELNARGAPGREAKAEQAEDGAVRTVSYSSDGGATWTVPAEAPGLPRYRETHSGLLRATVASGKSVHLFSFPNASKARQQGTIFLSDDDTQSWRVQKQIVPGAFGYSNLDQLPDGSFVVIYEARGIRVARFTGEWLRE